MAKLIENVAVYLIILASNNSYINIKQSSYTYQSIFLGNITYFGTVKMYFT